MMVRWAEICAAALLLVALPSLAQNRLALSPDGKLAAYTQGNALWVVRTAGKDRPQRVADIDDYMAVPRWAPSGDRLAYYSAQSGNLQLWLYDLHYQNHRQISFVEGGVNPAEASTLASGFASDPLRYSWSPDGTRIVFATQVRVEGARPSTDSSAPGVFPSQQQLDAGTPIVLTSTTPPDWTLNGVVSWGHVESRPYDGLPGIYFPKISPPQTTQLFVLDVASGKTTQLTHDAAGYFTPEWSPDGTRLVYMSLEGRTLVRPMLETNIFTLDLKTGKRTKITQGLMQKMRPHWSPDGKWISYHGKELTATFVRKDGHVYVVSSDTNLPARRVTSGIPGGVNHANDEWSPDGSSILTWYWDGLASPLMSVDVRSERVSAVSPVEAAVPFSGGVASSRGGVIWGQLTDPNGATELWFQGKQGKPRSLLELKPAADLRRERRWEVVRWTNSRGEMVEGILVYPLNYADRKRYPLVVDAYSGVSISRGSFDQGDYVRATLSYFIFRPNHRAPHMWLNPGKSATYTAAAVGPTGVKIMADDILSGVDQLIDRGLVDADRMCVAGFSNGALEGAQLLTQTQRFKCAVLIGGQYNWVSSVLLLDTATDGRENIRFMYGITPWEDPAIYTALSPVFHADKITTPVLLAMGDKERVMTTAVELFNALRYLKRDVTLLRYTTEGHGFTGAAKRDFATRVEAFFAKYIGEQKLAATHAGDDRNSEE